MDYTLSGSSVHGILKARILEWVAIPSTGDLPSPGIEPRSPALQADSLPSEPPGNQAERPPNPRVTVEDSASVLLVMGPFRVPKSITARFYRRYFRKVFLTSEGVITLHSHPRQPHRPPGFQTPPEKVPQKVCEKSVSGSFPMKQNP